MVKKVLCALLAILAVFSLAAGAGYGLAWYESNHVTIGGHSYYIYETELDVTDRELSIGEYEQLHAVLAECKITWMVPFQGKTYSNQTTSLAVSSLTQRDVDILLAYFPNLHTLDATGCEDYALLQAFEAAKESCKVTYQVNLGGKKADLDAMALTLESGEYTLEILTENLQYLPELAELTLRKPELTLEQIDSLKQAYPNLSVHCTVEILDQEYDNQTTALDLSALKAEDVTGVAQKLAMLPKLESVELMDAEGKSALSTADVKSLVNAAPNVSFHYSFDFYGQTLSSDMEEVVLTKVKIGDAGEAELRTALDLMPKVKRFVLDNCGFSNEVLAKVRDDYRDRTKVVWRISFGSTGSCLTDVEIFRCVGNLEKNYKAVQYCEDVVYMDIGHCERLRTIEFVAKMPKLKAVIFSGSEITDLSPLANCKELELLEVVSCGWLEDMSPVKNCTNLRMLNISDTKITDLSALDDLKLNYFVALHNSGKSRVSTEEQARFIAKHPSTVSKFEGKQPYGIGWRYEEDNVTFMPYYELLRIVFRYDMYPKESQQFGRYLSDVDPYMKEKLKESRTYADLLKAVEDEYAQWQAEAEAAAKAAAEAAAAEAAAEQDTAAEGAAQNTKTENTTKSDTDTAAETTGTEAADATEPAKG